MNLTSLTAAVALTVAPISLLAETIEVKMLNKGDAGAMVFEPRFVSANIGDTVVILPTDKSHSA